MASETTTDLMTPRSVVLCGSGGIGKTQIANEFVYRLRSKFEVILWISAASRRDIAQSFGQAAVALGLIEADSPMSTDYVLTRHALLNWLAKPLKTQSLSNEQLPEEVSWLVIFDNVEDPDVIEDYWPVHSPGSVLVTTQDPLVHCLYHSGGTELSLRPMQQTEAASLLVKQAGILSLSAQDRLAAEKIVDLVGGLPLALTQMAGVVSRWGLTLSRVLKAYEEALARRKKAQAQADLVRKSFLWLRLLRRVRLLSSGASGKPGTA